MWRPFDPPDPPISEPASGARQANRSANRRRAPDRANSIRPAALNGHLRLPIVPSRGLPIVPSRGLPIVPPGRLAHRRRRSRRTRVFARSTRTVHASTGSGPDRFGSWPVLDAATCSASGERLAVILGRFVRFDSTRRYALVGYRWPSPAAQVGVPVRSTRGRAGGRTGSASSTPGVAAGRHPTAHYRRRADSSSTSAASSSSATSSRLAWWSARNSPINSAACSLQSPQRRSPPTHSS